jgi:hypothetical protein
MMEVSDSGEEENREEGREIGRRKVSQEHTDRQASSTNTSQPEHS